MTPDQMGLQYESINFKAGDGTKLHGWFFPLPGKSPVILFCHGNAGNISHRLWNIQKLLSHGFQVFIYDYRGYGKSNGSPSRKGLYLDGLAAYDFLVKKRGISPDRIILFGRSLGAAVATEIAVQRQGKPPDPGERLYLHESHGPNHAAIRPPITFPAGPLQQLEENKPYHHSQADHSRQPGRNHPILNGRKSL